jgi:hypothetical protein
MCPASWLGCRRDNSSCSHRRKQGRWTHEQIIYEQKWVFLEWCGPGIQGRREHAGSLCDSALREKKHLGGTGVMLGCCVLTIGHQGWSSSLFKRWLLGKGYHLWSPQEQIPRR